MKDTIIQQCLEVLKRDDIKYELKSFFKPIIELIFEQVYPYIYIILSLVFLIFIMILAILILLLFILRNNKNILKIN